MTGIRAYGADDRSALGCYSRPMPELVYWVGFFAVGLVAIGIAKRLDDLERKRWGREAEHRT